MTSRYTDTLLTYDFAHYWRSFAGNFTTMPQYFKEHNYHTESIGKIFHRGASSNKTDDYPYSWSNVPFHPSSLDEKNKPVCMSDDGKLKKNLLCPVNVNFQPQKTLPDMQSTERAIEFLSNQSLESPFFLGVGFYKPHIPFKFPRNYLDLHPVDDFNKDYLRPFELPDVAWNPYNDLREREDFKALNVSFPFGPVPSEFAAKIRQHYYASVSYVDNLLGQILDSVDFTNTIVVLTSDHGWSLGEHSEWAKYSNYEIALKVPLIIYNPNRPQIRAQRIDAIGELLDLFPTITDIAGLPPILKCDDQFEQEDGDITCTEGNSLYGLMEGNVEEHDRIAYSQYPRPGTYPTKSPDSDRPKLQDIKIMGYTMRTKQFRYTAWIKFNHKKFKRSKSSPTNCQLILQKFFIADWRKIHGEELYDHSFDSQENINLAHRNGFEAIRSQLKDQLMKKFP